MPQPALLSRAETGEMQPVWVQRGWLRRSVEPAIVDNQLGPSQDTSWCPQWPCRALRSTWTIFPAASLRSARSLPVSPSGAGPPLPSWPIAPNASSSSYIDCLVTPVAVRALPFDVNSAFYHAPNSYVALERFISQQELPDYEVGVKSVHHLNLRGMGILAQYCGMQNGCSPRLWQLVRSRSITRWSSLEDLCRQGDKQ
jgi:hypothetical protein